MEIDHPRGKGGRFIRKGSEEAVTTAKAELSNLKEAEPTPETVWKAAEHLSILTVKQLRELHKEHGLSGKPEGPEGGIAQIYQRTVAGRRQAQSKGESR